VERPGAGGGGGIAADARVLQREVHAVVGGRLEPLDERILDPNLCNNHKQLSLKKLKNSILQFKFFPPFCSFPTVTKK